MINKEKIHRLRKDINDYYHRNCTLCQEPCKSKDNKDDIILCDTCYRDFIEYCVEKEEEETIEPGYVKIRMPIIPIDHKSEWILDEDSIINEITAEPIDPNIVGENWE